MREDTRGGSFYKQQVEKHYGKGYLEKYLEYHHRGIDYRKLRKKVPAELVFHKNK